MKENYATSENLRKKALLWLGRVEQYRHRRRRFRFDVRSSALLVLDMQNAFLDSDSHAHVPSSNAILPNVKSLIRLFRAAGRPIVFTRHSLESDEDPGMMGQFWGNVMREGTRASLITESLRPAPTEPVLRKTRYSAFVGTSLEDYLTRADSKALVISGVTTHLCCDSTARDAFMRDFAVFFPVDGTATWTEDLHVSSLLTLSDGFVIPVMTEELTGGGIEDEEDL